MSRCNSRNSSSAVYTCPPAVSSILCEGYFDILNRSGLEWIVRVTVLTDRTALARNLDATYKFDNGVEFRTVLTSN